MRRSRVTRRGLAIVAIALIVAACSSSGAGGSPGVATSVRPSAAPRTTPIATPEAASATTAPAGSSGPTTDIARPPAASLSVEGGEPVTGQLGSYTWNGGGSDSPWLPGAPITVGAGEQLTAVLDGGVGVATWSASRVAAGSSDGAGAVGLGDGDGSGSIAFASPATGHWSVQLTVRFAGERGSAAYYWSVTVR
jgi:hypothetical protein